MLWIEKSKQHWLEEDNVSLHIFHLATIIQRRAFSIDHILLDNNTLLSDWEGIEESFLQNYSNLFNSYNPSFPLNFHSIISFNEQISTNISLYEVPSWSKIRCTIFSVSSLKIPGPDGYTPFFFKHYWVSYKKT